MARPKASPAPAAGELDTYRAKRSADRTPEPFGPMPEPARAEVGQPRLFVVQKHDARRLHYDFRLEMGGVLVSWAVPKGPSTDPAEKRFAAKVEDHPVEYADFEGSIPEGNYGAGFVIVWDRGVWVPLEDPQEGMVKAKLLFELRGYKLRGVWTLVRIKSKGKEKSKEWLLIKHAGDAWTGADGARALTPESIYSGLTLEELREGSKRAEEIRDRPVVFTRYPDGIAGKSFFQKDAPGFVPGWVRTARMWSEHAQREIDYFVCDDVETLLYLANLGIIPLHIWSSRVSTLPNPDWCVLDLDPKGAPLTQVVEVARAVHDLCREMDLPSFPKTSGSTGLHVLVPLSGQCTYGQSRSLGEVMARVVCQRLPKIATTVRTVGSRGGRVYVDYLQDGHGRLLAAPFSVRPVPGAQVSTPLRWREVNARLDPAQFTMRTVGARLRRAKTDPLRPVLDLGPDLPRALARLSRWLQE